MQAKMFNPQIFLESLCYSVFGGLILYLAVSGKYLSYVTPRMEPYLYLTAIIMLIWACTGLRRLFRPQHKIRSAHCFVLVIPVLFLLLPHSALSTADLSARYVGGNAFLGSSRQSTGSTPGKQNPTGISSLNAAAGAPTESTAGEPAGGTGGAAADEVAWESVGEGTGGSLAEASGGAAGPADESSEIIGDDLYSTDTASSEDNILPDSADSTAPDIQTALPEDGDTAVLPGLDTKNRKITVANDDFGRWLAELYENMEKYKGYHITMTGFVFRDPEILMGALAENEFIPARLMMSCCAADLVPCGLICKYDGASGLKENSWVTVEGTLYLGKYKYDDGEEYDDPQITVTKITPASKAEGYVYPY